MDKKISYLTKDGAVPSTQARKVLFWICPEDREQWLAKIAGEFWQDESEYDFVFYYEFDLDEMACYADFMIILLSPALLQHEFPKLADFFQSRSGKAHIPVLPISVFTEDEERCFLNADRYKNVLEKIHFVRYRPTERRMDPVPNSYTLARSHFLRIACLKTQLLKEVRDAFKGNVFVSYRKKDHEIMSDLMRRIHDNPEFQSIALWHDDFLTPGENFNEEIREAIEKCRLFLMVVTPRILEQPNYVMKTEYPKACSLPKEILPVQMEPVSGDNLCRCYPGIPGCVDIRDEPGFEAEIRKAMRQAVGEGGMDSPRHDYLMGVAYLKGIDAEIDYVRAERLLTAAAAAGEIQAMELLGTNTRLGVFTVESEDKLQRVYHYQKTAMVRLLQEKSEAKEEALAWQMVPILENFFRNAAYLLEKSGNARYKLQEYPELIRFMLENENYWADNCDFEFPLYTKCHVIGGYEKYYSEKEKKWKIGKSMMKDQWKKTGSVLHTEPAYLLCSVYRSYAEACRQCGLRNRAARAGGNAKKLTSVIREATVKK